MSNSTHHQHLSERRSSSRPTPTLDWDAIRRDEMGTNDSSSRPTPSPGATSFTSSDGNVSPTSIMFPTNYNGRQQQRSSVQSSRPRPLTSKTSTPRRQSGGIGSSASAAAASSPTSASSSVTAQRGMTMNASSPMSEYSSRRSPLPSPTHLPRPSSNDLRQQQLPHAVNGRPETKRRESRDKTTATSNSHLPSSAATLKPSVLDRPRPKTPDVINPPPTAEESRQFSFAGPAYRADSTSTSATKNSSTERGLFGSTFEFDMARDKSLDLSLQPTSESAARNAVAPLPSLPSTASNGSSATSLNNVQPRLEGGRSAIERSDSTTKKSVLDRPRPKTPDSAQAFLSGSGSGSSSKIVHHSDSIPTASVTPGGSVSNTPIKGLTTPLSDSPTREWHGSVLDRPRPRTPDAHVFLVGNQSRQQSGQIFTPSPSGSSTSPRPPSFSKAPPETHAKQSMIPITSPTTSPTITRQSPQLQQPPLMAASVSNNRSSDGNSNWSRRIEAYRRSEDSTRPTTYNMPRSTSNTSALSRTSGSSVSSSSLAPPTLSLDLDFAGSGTMFDLSSLLKIGEDDDEDEHARTPVAERKPPLDAVTTPKLTSSGFAQSTDASRSAGSEFSTTTTTVVSEPPFQAPEMSTLSLVPSRGGATTPLGRKEPPKVDPLLALELELEQSMALNKPVFDDVASPSEPVNRTSSHVPGPTAPNPEQARTVAQQTTTTKRRKNSLASLLSFASTGPSIVEDSPKKRQGSVTKDMIRHEGSFEGAQVLPQYELPASGLSNQSLSRHDGDGERMTPSTSGLSTSTMSHGSSRESHGRHNIPLDKTLPPTPSDAPSSRRKFSEGGISLNSVNDKNNSPSKKSISKQFQKFRTRAQGSGERSGFQVLSATTTRKSFSGTHNDNEADVKMRQRVSNEHEAEATRAHTATSAASSSASRSVGRRFLGKIGAVGGADSGRKSNGGSASAFASDMSVDDRASSSNRDSGGSSKFFKRPRRSSVSGLLDGDGSNLKEDSKGQRKVSGSGAGGAGMLGMSLAAARRSADMLTSWPRKDKASTSKANEANGISSSSSGGGRKSFDFLSRKDKGDRPNSGDNFRDLTSAKLSPVQNRGDLPLQPGFRAPSRATRPETPGSSNSSASGHDSDDDYDDDDEIDRRVYGAALPAHASVATAQRVVRQNGTTSTSSPASNSSPTLSRGSVTPVLVQGSSLRQQKTMPQPSADRSVNGAHDTTDTDTDAARSLSRSSDIFSTPQMIQTPDTDQSDRTTLGPFAAATTLSAEWMLLDTSLTEYTSAIVANVSERGNVLVNVLIPFLKREESNPSRPATAGVTSMQRDILFRWLSLLTTELREMQPAHRGACLESVAAIAETHFLSAATLQDDPFAQARYRASIVDVLSFAVDKLNEKAVYANTLVFSGRVMALAFFRIEGVAVKLLRALPRVKRQCFSRVLAEAGVKESQLPTVNLELFPAHLWSLCLRDMKSYLDLLLPPVRKPVPASQLEDEEALVRDSNVVVEMAGNWLIRWTASDSDLPFAFYRAYHRQLAHHLVPLDQRRYLLNQHPLDPASVITAPGALFLAASLLEKCDSLVHRNLRSVTSIGPNNSNFNTNDSANLSFGQKPKILELANRRLVQTMLDIVGGPPPAPGAEQDLSADTDVRRHAFSRLLQLWIRASMKRTSMWDTRSVFILLDLIEGLIYTLSYPAPSSRESDIDLIVPKPSESSLDLFDIPFIFSCVKIILGKADNTVTLMRTIAFIYAHFEIFTLRPSDRDELCERVILDEELFERLYLHWNAGVRGYFIRLLVWRLSRLGITDAEQHPDRPRDPRILAIFGLMNVRLEAIRKRHDELEPVTAVNEEDDFFQPKRSTICSTRGVKEAPFTVDELAQLFESDTEDDEDDSQELVSSAMPAAENGRKSTGGIKEVATVARVVSWLKGGLGKKSGGRRGDLFSDDDSTSSPTLDKLDAFGDDDIEASTRTSGSDETRSSTTASAPTTLDTEVDDASSQMTPEAASKKSKRSSRGPAFFAFEFENGLSPRSDMVDDNSPTARTVAGLPSLSDAASVTSTGTADTVFPLSSGLRRSTSLDPNSAPPPHAAVVSPRVSARFSKRISILPPAALELFKEGGDVPAVPLIPAQYRREQPRGYDRKLHPYAVRGLRDYEDALDEWTDWVARLQEEEDEGRKHNRGFVDTVPRLAVSWPQSFEEGA
ncbi:hypothetical protein OIO90_003532 [Microbotryomycetes sp. JL221]|nr:hypothetical protein OIO90_003532 [Microbotryomycetes sp. JL221]